MIIIFDSTVLISNFHLKGPSFRLFRWFIENTDAELVVPKVVVQEAKNKFKEEAKSIYDSYTAKLKELTEHLNGLSEPFDQSINLKKLFKKYNKELDENLKSYDAKIPSYIKIPHSALVKRDLAGKRPFRKIGKKGRESTGYRDCLIWETILRKIAPGADEIVFITNNKADFWDINAKALHGDLVKDLTDNDLDEGLIKLCEDLESFNKTFVIPKIPKVEKAKIDLERGEYYEFSVKKWFEDNTSEVIDRLQEEVYVPLEEFYFEVVSSKINWIDFINFSVDEVLKLDSKTVLIDVDINATFSIDLDVISRGLVEDLYDLPIDMDFNIHDRNYASITIWVEFPINVQLLFDIDRKKVEGFEAKIPLLFGFCYKCGEPLFSDAIEKCPKCGK